MMNNNGLLFPLVGSDAQFSPCGRYRYKLTRTWHNAYPVVAWLMLNPSTADAEEDDPTIRRCIRFSKSWGYGGLIVLNLFAWRATDPTNLPAERGVAVGPRNDAWIQSETTSRRVVCAWGAHGETWGRGREVIAELRRMGCRDLVCLGTTKDGNPRHPLYVAGRTPLQPISEVPA